MSNEEEPTMTMAALEESLPTAAPETEDTPVAAPTPTEDTTKPAEDVKEDFQDAGDLLDFSNDDKPDEEAAKKKKEAKNDEPPVKPTVAVAETTPPSTESSSSSITDPVPPQQTRVTDFPMEDAAGNTGKFTGLLDKATQTPVQGRCEYDNHIIYNGGWAVAPDSPKACWHGTGKAYLLGDVYEGDYQFGKRHGVGAYIWRDGRKYRGQFDQDQRHGMGIYTWPNGATYEGSFWQGIRQGHGKFTSGTAKKEESSEEETPPQLSYVGEWQNGLYHGYGVYEEKGVRLYRGQWKMGKACGYGMEYDAYGRIQHDGEWENDQPKIEKKVVAVSNVVLTDANGLPGLYRGTVDEETKLPQGAGTMTYKDGSIEQYEGFWVSGYYQGHGRIQWKNGDTYEGDYVDGKRQGKGTYAWADGRHYQGEFQNDQRHGKGLFLYPNGDSYEGKFKAGKRHGPGQFVFTDGSVYKGEWQDGVYGGQGELVTSDGKTYRGNFEKGLQHGQGTELDAMGNVIYEGEWVHGVPASKVGPGYDVNAEQTPILQRTSSQTIPPPLHVTQHQQYLQKLRNNKKQEEPCKPVVDQVVTDAQGNEGKYTGIVLVATGVPHGVGRMVYQDGRIHEGFWNRGNRHGHGRCLFREGDFHQGEYVDNLRHGPGTYQWKDGRVYKGNYMNDLRHGFGDFSYPNGDKYSGMFEEGQRSGSGTFTFADGSYYDGEWKSGKYHGHGKLSDGEKILEGDFVEGVIHGEGKEMDPDGTITFEGQWNKGQRVKEDSSGANGAKTGLASLNEETKETEFGQDPLSAAAPPTVLDRAQSTPVPKSSYDRDAGPGTRLRKSFADIPEVETDEREEWRQSLDLFE